MTACHVLCEFYVNESHTKSQLTMYPHVTIFSANDYLLYVNTFGTIKAELKAVLASVSLLFNSVFNPITFDISHGSF